MKHGSLFSGIGGFDLAAQWMGWENVFHCEINKHSSAVLNKNFPGTPNVGDIRILNGYEYKNSIDILSGGFPCQPFSNAGKRKGTADNRHLWPEMLRVIREISPRWVVGENVYGLFNWDEGLVFEQVCNDLEKEGYQVWPYIIPASAVGAYHNRNRVWIIGFKANAHDTNTNIFGSHREEVDFKGGPQLQHQQICLPGSLVSQSVQQGVDPGVFRATDGVSGRVDRLIGVGNAIVPQVVYQIFKAIEAYETKQEC